MYRALAYSEKFKNEIVLHEPSYNAPLSCCSANSPHLITQVIFDDPGFRVLFAGRYLQMQGDKYTVASAEIQIHCLFVFGRLRYQRKE